MAQAKSPSIRRLWHTTEAAPQRSIGTLDAAVKTTCTRAGFPGCLAPCLFVFYRCGLPASGMPDDRCNFEGFLSECIEYHKKCDYATEHCYCGNAVSRKQQAEHSQVCPERMVECPVCKIVRVQSHLCPEQHVECEICNHKVPRKDLNMHMALATTQHIELLKTQNKLRAAELEAKNQGLQAKSEVLKTKTRHRKHSVGNSAGNLTCSRRKHGNLATRCMTESELWKLATLQRGAKEMLCIWTMFRGSTCNKNTYY